LEKTKMTRTAIEIKLLSCTSTRPDRLKASTMSTHPISATVGYWSDAADSEEQRYEIALQALLAKLGDGWGDASQWVAGMTDEGRVYIRLDAEAIRLIASQSA
jgi:hypothetical protein